MQTCAETLNWGPDRSLWSLEDPTRMVRTWQFPVWIIMFCLLNVSHALSISMIIIFTLQPTLRYKWGYLLLNSCHAAPQNQQLVSGDAGAESFVIWHALLVEPGSHGTPGHFSVSCFGNASGWKVWNVEELTLSKRGTNKWVEEKGWGSHCKFREITAGEETSAAAQGWTFSMTSAVHQAAVEEWRGAAAPISLTGWFKELFFAAMALCLSVALKGRECFCSLIGICLKNNKKKKGKTRECAIERGRQFSTLNPWSAVE